MSSIFSSSCFGVGTHWSKEWHQDFAPTCGAGISDILWMETAGAGPLSAIAHSWAVVNICRMVASGTSLVRICRGYRSASWVSGGQAHTATPKASMKAWQSQPSSIFASCSSANTLSL